MEARVKARKKFSLSPGLDPLGEMSVSVLISPASLVSGLTGRSCAFQDRRGHVLGEEQKNTGSVSGRAWGLVHTHSGPWCHSWCLGSTSLSVAGMFQAHDRNLTLRSLDSKCLDSKVPEHRTFDANSEEAQTRWEKLVILRQHAAGEWDGRSPSYPSLILPQIQTTVGIQNKTIRYSFLIYIDQSAGWGLGI